MSTAMQETLRLVVDPELIRRFDISGPRYTSYPTADRFVEAFGPAQYARWLGSREVGGLNRPLSLYVHIPFCNTICYYCACNKIITKDHSRSARYLDFLEREIELVDGHLAGGREVTQLHLGGGTPTFLAEDEMRRLMAAIRAHFQLAEHGEFSIEVDPRKVDAAQVALLAELGFNRMSIGVQDFDPLVQAAVNRIQSFDETAAVLRVVPFQLPDATALHIPDAVLNLTARYYADHTAQDIGAANIVTAIKALHEASLRPAVDTCFLISNYEEVGHGGSSDFPEGLEELVALVLV